MKKTHPSTKASFNNNSEELSFTWERLIPKQIGKDSASQKICEIHLKRYETAMRYVKGKRVLDIACGAGYGSHMLAQAGASKVVGVDLCDHTIEYAKKHYQNPAIEFICADAETFNWQDKFDVVISFETVEHLPKPAKFLENIRRLLVSEGDLLLSVPLGETRHIDRYHLHAFSQEDVWNLLKEAGFFVERYRCDDFFLTLSELIHWRRVYPDAQLTVSELLLTTKIWKIIRDSIFQGGVAIPELFVAARANSDRVSEVKLVPQYLE
jgi:ubiquinone biosynthesis O-methyltransferase